MKLLLLCVCTLFATFCIAAKLPTTFSKCSPKQSDFNACLSKAIENVLPILNEPYKELGLPSFKPWKLPTLVFDAGTGAIALQQKYKNVEIFGITEPKSVEAKMDFKAKVFQLHGVFSQAVLNCEYEVSGKVMMIPFVGKGPASVELDDVTFDMTTTFEEYVKNGLEHYRIVKNEFMLTPGLARFKMENTLDTGDNLVGQVVKVLNENWKDAWIDTGKVFEATFVKFVTKVFNQFLEKVPLVELSWDE